MDTSQNPPGVSCLIHSGQVTKQHESSSLYDSREGLETRWTQRISRNTEHIVNNCKHGIKTSLVQTCHGGSSNIRWYQNSVLRIPRRHVAWLRCCQAHCEDDRFHKATTYMHIDSRHRPTVTYLEVNLNENTNITLSGLKCTGYVPSISCPGAWIPVWQKIISKAVFNVTTPPTSRAQSWPLVVLRSMVAVLVNDTHGCQHLWNPGHSPL